MSSCACCGGVGYCFVCSGFASALEFLAILRSIVLGRNLSRVCKQAGLSACSHKGLRRDCAGTMFSEVRVKAGDIAWENSQRALTDFYIILQRASSSIYSSSTEITPAYISDSSRKSIILTSPCMVSIQLFPFSHHMLIKNMTYSHFPKKGKGSLLGRVTWKFHPTTWSFYS